MDEKERLRRYRRYVYEAGAVNRSDKGFVEVIDQKVLEKERTNDLSVTFLCRDGIVGAVLSAW